MTYYGGKELAEAFRTVRKNTIQIAEDIPENKYDFKPAPDSRSVRETLAHVATATNFQNAVHSLKVTDMKTVNFPELFQRLVAEEQKPRTKVELVAYLKSEGDKFAEYLESLPEAFLSEVVTMTPQDGGGQKTRFEMVLGAKEHEMHHRGQLMTIERILGVVPHLTRLMQERMAQMQAAQQSAGQR